MIIEAKCYSPKKSREDVLVSSRAIPAGDHTMMNFFRGRLAVAISNSMDGSQCLIRVGGNRRRIRAMLHEGVNDEQGTRIGIARSILITGEQILSLETKKGKPKNQIVIFPRHENSNNRF